jgi:DtxR family Mn-dependent transcriptional regulator
MATSNIQEYLETLYSLEEERKPATTNEVAKRLGFSAPSVTEMLKHLDEEGYVHHEPYKGVTLTEKGRLLARKVKRKHRILERFLHDILNLRKDRAHKQACEMEHTLSDDVEKGLWRILGYPRKCPDGKPIPNPDRASGRTAAYQSSVAEQTLPQEEFVPLVSLRTNQKATVRQIRGGRLAVGRLEDLGVTPGIQVQLISRAPLGGPVEILVRGSHLAIGHGLAMKILVEAC